jgi:Xaa-Pro aminopeptidase
MWSLTRINCGPRRAPDIFSGCSQGFHARWEFTHGILNSQRNMIPYAGESDFAFASGDAIRTDYVAYVKGYPGHQSRCAVLGTPSAEQRRQYALIRDIYKAANDQLVPGRMAGEVHQFVVERFGGYGLQIYAGRSQR